MRDVVMLQDLRASDAGLTGAKAANLGELLSAGVPVPDGFCLPVTVYDSTVTPVVAGQVQALAGDPSGDRRVDSARALRETIEAVTLPAALRSAITDAYRALCPDGGRVAVRSSGTSEDSATASFAGQYHTELAVGSVDELVAAVKRCWASLWEVHAIRYREDQAIPHTEASMAVIVQVMVPAESAGVMFTVDPHAGPPADGTAAPASAGRIVIESSWGYGEAVVSGLVTPDRFDVSRADAHVENIEVSHKVQMVALPSGGRAKEAGGGTTLVDVPPERQTAASLTPAQATGIARYGLAIEAHFGAPQDVEWAVAGGEIAILQARPLTHPPTTSAAPPDVQWESPIDGAWWARISICDSWLPEPLSPLFATTLFPCLVKRWAQNWAGPEAAQRENPVLPKPMSGTINGFAYLRLDYPMNKYPLRTVRLAFNCYRFHLGRLERRWRTAILPHHVARIEALRRKDLAGMETEDLLELIDEVQELSGKYWAILGGLAWYWNAGEWLLATVYPRIVKSITNRTDAVPGHGTLLQGYRSKTAEADLALYDLARSDESTGELPRRFDEFLTRYGHQVYQLDFVEPTPAEDPSSFRTTIEAYRDGRAPDPHRRLRTLAERRETTRTRFESALRRSPLKSGVLKALLSWNRRYGQVRDEALFYFTLGWPLMRRGYLELGRRLVAAGALGSDQDVFFLTGGELVDELRTAARGGAPREWGQVVRERRSRRDEQQLLSPPVQVPSTVRIFMGKVDVTSIALLGQHAKAKEGDGMRGSAVSPGRVTAAARRISSVRDFEKLQAGEVLVAPYITPAWSSLLAIAGGVVTDTGGTLSHGSIVAREYGIPAVMGVSNATKTIQDGQMVTVDGNRGLVY
ncbi:PEP/pyruvate-binding domain-containing protein [Streptomyces sioyaensis]|uniref:PEP/pyruvate-binding domain-containing protein n=1 Tax=Streptomyces sioyaensis TaxID=67364 RepID=UPI00367EE1EF